MSALPKWRTKKPEKEAEGEGKYIRQSGGRGQYGHALVRIAPKAKKAKGLNLSMLSKGCYSREFINPIEKGVKESLENGVIAGYPMVDVSVTLYDGSFHEVDSSEIAFKIAGSMAVQAAARESRTYYP